MGKASNGSTRSSSLSPCPHKVPLLSDPPYQGTRQCLLLPEEQVLVPCQPAELVKQANQALLQNSGDAAKLFALFPGAHHPAPQEPHVAWMSPPGLCMYVTKTWLSLPPVQARGLCSIIPTTEPDLHQGGKKGAIPMV